MTKTILLILLSVTTLFAQNQSNFIIDGKAIKVDSLLWDLALLSKTPAVEWLDKKSRVHSLLYKSVDYEGHPTQLFAYYSNPDILAGRPPGKQKFPGVVLIHGGGGKAFKVWAEKWASEGYAAVAMDLSGLDGDGRKLALAGADQSNENKFDKIEKAPLKDVWTYHAVASSILAHSLLLSFPEVNPSKTVVTGISWGGYLTCIVGSLDNRFKAAVPVYGCGFYDESDVFRVPLEKLSAVNRGKWMRYFDPSIYMPFSKAQFCFVNGDKDKHYNVVPYSKTYNLVPQDRRTVLLLPDMKHSHEWGWEPHEIRYFVESVLNKMPALTRVGKVTRSESEITALYNGPVSPWFAEFYFSNDTTSTNEERVWTKQSAKINEAAQTLSSPLPKQGFKYGFFYMKDHRNLSASSEFIID